MLNECFSCKSTLFQRVYIFDIKATGPFNKAILRVSEHFFKFSKRNPLQDLPYLYSPSCAKAGHTSPFENIKCIAVYVLQT